MEREQQLTETIKNLAIADKLAQTSQNESSALKNLCGKLEVELEGTKSRLSSVEQAHVRECGAMGEEAKILARENRRVSEQVKDAEESSKNKVEHWKRIGEANEAKAESLSERNRVMGEELVELKSKVEVLGKENRKFESMTAENENIKRQLWKLENDLREKEIKLQHGERTIDQLKNKNEEMHRVVERVDDVEFKHGIGGRAGGGVFGGGWGGSTGGGVDSRGFDTNNSGVFGGGIGGGGGIGNGGLLNFHPTPAL